MKRLVIIALVVVGAAVAITLKLRPSAESKFSEALKIVARLVERDRAHPIYDDARVSKDSSAIHSTRQAAIERTVLNCNDFAALRPLIEAGRPFADYTPIEKLGHFVGSDPNRFFITGIEGYVPGQGPEPYSIKIDLDKSNVIRRVGFLVASP